MYVAIGVLSLAAPSNGVLPELSSDWSLSLPLVKEDEGPLIVNAMVVISTTLSITLVVSSVQLFRHYHQSGPVSSWSATKRMLVATPMVLSLVFSVWAATVSSSLMAGS